MPMIKCSECQHEISDKAISCPNCGFPINIDDSDKDTYCINPTEVYLKREQFFLSMLLAYGALLSYIITNYQNIQIFNVDRKLILIIISFIPTIILFIWLDYAKKYNNLLNDIITDSLINNFASVTKIYRFVLSVLFLISLSLFAFSMINYLSQILLKIIYLISNKLKNNLDSVLFGATIIVFINNFIFEIRLFMKKNMDNGDLTTKIKSLQKEINEKELLLVELENNLNKRRQENKNILINRDIAKTLIEYNKSYKDYINHIKHKNYTKHKD